MRENSIKSQLQKYKSSWGISGKTGVTNAFIQKMFEKIDVKQFPWNSENEYHGNTLHLLFIDVIYKIKNDIGDNSAITVTPNEYTSKWAANREVFTIGIKNASDALKAELGIKSKGQEQIKFYPQDFIALDKLVQHAKKQVKKEQAKQESEMDKRYAQLYGVPPKKESANISTIASDTFASLKEGGVSLKEREKRGVIFNAGDLATKNFKYASAKQELAKAEKLENRAYYFQEITRQIIEKQGNATRAIQPVPRPERAIEIVRRAQRSNLVQHLKNIINRFEINVLTQEVQNDIAKLKEIAAKLDSGLFQSGHDPQLEIKEIVKMKKSLDDLVAGLERPANFPKFLANFLPADGDINAGQAAQYARYHLDYLLLTYTDKYKNFHNDNRNKGGKPQSYTVQDIFDWAQAFYKKTHDETTAKKAIFDTAKKALESLKDRQGRYFVSQSVNVVAERAYNTLNKGASDLHFASKLPNQKRDIFKNKREAVKKFNQAEIAVEKAKETILDLAALTQPEDKEIMNDLFKKIANFDKEGLDLISKSLTGDAEISSTIPKSGGAVDIRDEDSEIGTSVTKKVSTELVKFALGKDIVEPVKKYIAAQQEFKQAEAEKQYFAEFYPYTQAFSHSVRSAPRAVMNKPGAIAGSVLGGVGSQGRAENHLHHETAAAALAPDAVARAVANQYLITLSEQIKKRGATWDNGNVRPLQEFIHFAHNEDFDAATISEFLVTRNDKVSEDAEKVEDQTLLLELAVLSLENNHPALAITRNNVFLQSLQGDEVVKEFLTTYIDQEIRAHLLESKQIRGRSAFVAKDSNNSRLSEGSDHVSYTDAYGNTPKGNTTQTKSFFSLRRGVGGGGSSHSSDGNSGFNTMFKPRAYSFTNSQEDKKALKKWNATHRKVNRTVESKGGLQPGDKLATGLEVGVVNFSGMGLDKLISHVEDMIANYDEQDENYRQALTQERHEFLVAQAKEVFQIYTDNSMNDTEKSEQLTKVIGKIDKVTLSKDEAEARKIYNNVVSCFNAIKNHYSLVVEHKGESEPSHDARTASKVGDAAKFPRSLSFSERIENDKNNTPEIKRSNSR